MAFLSSVFLGTPGAYQIIGIDVTFEKGDPIKFMFVPEITRYQSYSTLKNRALYFSQNCLNSRVFHASCYVFRLMTQGYLHVLVHEMGHAIAEKLLTHRKPKVSVYTDSCTGDCRGSIEPHTPYRWVPYTIESIILVSGPMTDVAFCALKLVTATALRSYLSTPIAITLGFSAVIWIVGELGYAIQSTYCRDEGDFGRIARNGEGHLGLASVALVAEVAFGIFAVTRST
jgi:hypothetical protein